MKSDSSRRTEIAHRHHFVPRFYLRAWSGEQGQLWVYGRNRAGELYLRRRPDKAVAYVEDLYALRSEGVHPALEYVPDAIEREFFSHIDNNAAVVHAKLVAQGPAALSSTERETWALFLNSLLERCPRRLAELQKTLPEVIEESKRTWPANRLGPGFENVDWAAMAHNNLLCALGAYINDREFIDYLAKMEWRVVCLKEDSEDHFLTSDAPLVVNGGLPGSPIKLLSIALTPKRLLVIHSAASEFDVEFLATLAMMHGFQVTKQAEKHVFSSKKLTDSKHVKYFKGVEGLLGRT